MYSHTGYLCSMNIMVLNLPRNVGEGELKKLFEGYGKVESAKIVLDKEKGVSKGFAFVEMADESEATKAIEALHGSKVGNQNIRVKESKPVT